MQDIVCRRPSLSAPAAAAAVRMGAGPGPPPRCWEPRRGGGKRNVCEMIDFKKGTEVPFQNTHTKKHYPQGNKIIVLDP